MWLCRWGIRGDRWYPKSQIFTLGAPEYNAVAIRMSPADETHCPRQVVAVVVDGDNENARGCRGVAGEAGNRGESFGVRGPRDARPPEVSLDTAIGE